MVARAEFEGALRYDEQLLPATAVAIASGKESEAVAIPGTPEVPAADPDREVIWTVDGSTVRFDLSALRAKPAVTVTPTTVLDSTNSVVFSVGSTLCMLARTAASETAASQFLFSADRADTYSVELAVSSIDLEPWARRSNATKVAAANLPSPWLTQAQVDARVRALENRGDPMEPGTFVGERLTTGGANNGKIGSVGITFTPVATQLTIDTVIQNRDDNGIEVRVTPQGRIADLRGLKLSINDRLLSFDDATDLEDEAAYTQARWPNQPAGTVKVGQNTVTVYKPLGQQNYVPKADDGDANRLLAWDATQDLPVWREVLAALRGVNRTQLQLFLASVINAELTGGDHVDYGLLKNVPRATGLRILHAGPAVPLPIANTNERADARFRALAPAFDLDDNPTGELHVVMTVTINSSWIDLGFSIDIDRDHTFNAIVFASDVSKLGTYVHGGIETLEVGSSADLYAGINKLGPLSFYLAKNANNELGYLLRYGGGGTVGASLNLGATMEVSFSPTDAPAATSSTGHVGPLIAKLTIPAGTLAANANPGAAWVVQSGVPTGFDVTDRSNGQLNVPRTLPDTMAGVVVRTKVGTTTVSQVFLPWVPIHKDVAWSARIGPALFATNVFQLLVSDDSTVRTVKLVLQREWGGTAKDRLEVVGNAERIKAGTTIELFQWV